MSDVIEQVLRDHDGTSYIAYLGRWVTRCDGCSAETEGVDDDAAWYFAHVADEIRKALAAEVASRIQWPDGDDAASRFEACRQALSDYLTGSERQEVEA